MKRVISFAVCLFVCQVMCYAQPVVVKSSDKITAAIRLRNATPSSTMLTAKIFNPKDILMSQSYVWQREKQSASASFKPEVDLTGIDRITASDKDSILTVCGDNAAVERFTKEVLALDIARKKVQLSVQVYSIEADKAKEIGLEGTLNASADQSQTEATKIALLKDNAQLLNSPIITTLDYSVAEIFISEDPSSTLRAIPYINGDETITLVLYAAVDRKEKGQIESTFTQMRVEDGRSFLVGGFVGGHYDTSSKLLLLVTPTAIK